MPRRYRRRRYAVSRPVKTTKYSNETFAFQSILFSEDDSDHAYSTTRLIPVLTNGSFLGTRKVKNFTIRVAPRKTQQSMVDPTVEGTVDSVIYWALVYVPEGTSASELHVGTNTIPASLYDPNQNVIASGMASSATGITTVKTRLARNLNSNDNIVMILWDTRAPATGVVDSTTTVCFVSINFAIAF